MAARTTTHLTRIHTVAIPSADQGRAIAFYTETLGLEVRRDTTFGPGLRWVEVAPPGSQATIALPPRGDAPVGIDTGIRLACDDAHATHDDLREAGVDVHDVMDFGPGVPPMFSLRDPDGNTLYVVEAA